jgi:N-acetylmuramic acid 6-phosphate etherase
MLPQKQKLDNFLKASSEFRLGELETEKCHPLTRNLSFLAQNDLHEAIKILQKIDLDVVTRLSLYRESISEIGESIRETFDSGGRLFICGCGATGRLALTIEKLWRDKVSKGEKRAEEKVIGFMAGGDVALIRSIENFEDFPHYGARQLVDLGFSENDLLISCTEGGETPFVIGATERAAEISKRKPFFLYCNEDSSLSRVALRSKRVLNNDSIRKVNLFVGPMALSGSTRLQATTIQMLCVGLALLEFEKASSELEKLKNFLSGHKLSFLKDFVEKECSLYQVGKHILYSTNEVLGITILTDTTERAPTFNLNPFENFHDQMNEASKAYLFFPHSSSSSESWKLLLGREPRTFHWREVTDKTSSQRLKGFDFSQNLLSLRKQTGILHEFFSIYKTHGGLQFKLDYLDYFLPIEPCSPLIVHIILKILLNSLSTLVMGKLGRYEGNLMTWVRPSNNKLIDRAIRYTQVLLEDRAVFVPYKDVARVCFEILEKERWNRSLVDEMVSTLLRKQPLSNLHR